MTTRGIYRKRPVEIEAIQWTGDNYAEILDFAKDTQSVQHSPEKPTALRIITLEGVMTADLHDWIIRGIKGEFYPCKPDIFDKTYERVACSPDRDKAIEAEMSRLKAAFLSAAGHCDDCGDTFPLSELNRPRQGAGYICGKCLETRRNNTATPCDSCGEDCVCKPGEKPHNECGYWYCDKCWAERKERDKAWTNTVHAMSKTFAEAMDKALANGSLKILTPCEDCDEAFESKDIRRWEATKEALCTRCYGNRKAHQDCQGGSTKEDEELCDTCGKSFHPAFLQRMTSAKDLICYLCLKKCREAGGGERKATQPPMLLAPDGTTLPPLVAAEKGPLIEFYAYVNEALVPPNGSIPPEIQNKIKLHCGKCGREFPLSGGSIKMDADRTVIRCTDCLKTETGDK